MSSLTGKSLNPVMNRRSVIASAAGLGAMSIRSWLLLQRRRQRFRFERRFV